MASSSPPPPNLVPFDELPQSRRPYGSKQAVIGHQGLVYTPSGVYAHIAEPFLTTESTEKVDDETNDLPDHDNSEVDEQRIAKKQRQWRKWSEDIIPALLKPYLTLLSETAGLRDMSQVDDIQGCTGCARGRLLYVSCIYFQKIKKVVLCTCTEPALQLLSRGLFPCAPSEPTLAVDLNVLEFARGLFVNAAPNTTAWCETLEGFLSSRDFKLATRNSLRGRFGNALHWYATLTDTKNLAIRDYLDQVRGSILAMDNDDSTEENDIIMHEPQAVPDVEMSDASSPGINSEFILKIKLTWDRPSEYLRERCPLCFGGENWKKKDDLVDAIVCIDACFTQKRRKSQGKAWQEPRVHPETIFIPTDELTAMEEKVETIRPSKKKNNSNPKLSKGKEKEGEGPDYEPKMKVPSSVLNECHDSFAAADERRNKASTVFFADTALMALLCRHDRVLWLANMTSAGEKQHYALALLHKLFEHIPKTMRVGLLYDIGCQLHRSCAKFDFLGDFLDRIVFGISVFHAYGHQWPCQIIYHPRKCKGFGLTDGEGCERFWSAIKALIPSCRVSSYFNRIYTIDTKIKHLDQKSMLGLGLWIRRKWITTGNRKTEAAEILQVLYNQGYTEEFLREQWDDQVAEQTKPLKRQSKNLANKEIEEILALTKSVENDKKELNKLDNMLVEGEYQDGLDPTSAAESIEELNSRMKKNKNAIAYKRGKLSVDGRMNLGKLMGNEFLKVRMNALAVKQRIRDRLRQRKFEIENLERAYRNTMNHAKLQKHSEQSFKKKEPGIQTLARNYNKLCSELIKLISSNRAPRGAVAPLQIQLDGLFKLDVDDDIWQDIGLTDNNDNPLEIPAWLGNDDVRVGIKALLEYDRCVEEERRLREEKLSMQQWMYEEWGVLMVALNWAEAHPDMIFQLNKRKEYLLKLCIAWQPQVLIIPDELDDSWGPSDAEIEAAKRLEVTESVVEDDEIFDFSEGEQEDMDEAELLDNLEVNAIDINLDAR
ncbi:hypothetical protein GALMADRAFT_62166 [Galerina marginata CBS 339.88]|uniref:CxC1-like cysteine cluster associated with KDZ transposases domain-containing protein n=1 Tax=Galerina marginata (strain CBS 339.88) TaxID=685588 RepID=A0A067TBD6_GALM3|nr:hypothetical protein GALMADRAFT_62166 [Galerina marginata CBS 339.88]